MHTPKEDMASRVLALIHAMKTLELENVGTPVVLNRIRKRLSEILEANPCIEEIIAEFHAKAELAVTNNHQKPELPESKIPAELRQKLSKDQLILVETLLRLGPDGEVVSVKDLVRAIYNEEHDDRNPCPDKLRVTVMMTRKKITGWSTIHTKKGVGYWLEVEAQ